MEIYCQYENLGCITGCAPSNANIDASMAMIICLSRSNFYHRQRSRP